MPERPAHLGYRHPQVNRWPSIVTVIVLCVFVLFRLDQTYAQSTKLTGDIPIDRLIDTASAKIGISVRYDPSSLRQSVTIRSAEPMSDAELWRQLNDALRSIEFTTVALETPGSYEVVQLRNASAAAYIERESGSGPHANFPTPGFRAVLLSTTPLDPLSAVSLVQPLVSAANGKVVALPGSGEILVSDLASRVSVVESTLSRARSTEGEIVIQSMRAPPGRAVEYASTIKQLAERQRTAGGRPLRGDVIASADASSITLVSPDDEIVMWSKLAEQAWPPTFESKPYFVAEFDSQTLRSVFEEAISAMGSAGEGATLFANTYTGSVTVTARPETHDRLAGLAQELRELPASARLSTERIPVRRRIAASLAEQLSMLLQSDQDQRSPTSIPESVNGEIPPPTTAARSSSPQAGPVLTIDEATNSLLVTGTPAQVASVRDLVQQLDTTVPQVMLEVLMVSLSDSETLDLGVELDRIEVGGGTLYRLSSLFGLGADASATSLPSGGNGLSGVVLDPGEFSVLVRALETVNEGRSLSMPRVLVANSQEAEFNSVTQQPILSTNASDVVATTSFGGFEDAGTTISVSPQILAGEQLNLDYSVTLSAFVGESSDPALPPPRQQNQLASAVTIPDSYTVAVGGIELETSGEAISQVPLIGSVPIIGELFKNRSRSSSRTKFYVFIKASIYQDDLFERLRYASDSTAEEAGVPTGWPVIEPRVIR